MRWENTLIHWKTEVTRFLKPCVRKGHVYMPFGP
jgi:hypothetical protein